MHTCPLKYSQMNININSMNKNSDCKKNMIYSFEVIGKLLCTRENGKIQPFNKGKFLNLRMLPNYKG